MVTNPLSPDGFVKIENREEKLFLPYFNYRTLQPYSRRR